MSTNKKVYFLSLSLALSEEVSAMHGRLSRGDGASDGCAGAHITCVQWRRPAGSTRSITELTALFMVH